MKKIFMLFVFSFMFFTSCKNEKIENINIYTDSDLRLLIEEIISSYENDNKNIKINVTSERPKNFEKIDILLTSNNDIFNINSKNIKDNKNTEKEKIEKLFFKTYFTEDFLVIIGRKKITNLNDLFFSSIAIPNYENIVGKLFIDNFQNSDIFADISKNIQYKKDSISAMQSVDLYEADYAVINSLLLSYIKNSKLCYSFSKNQKEDSIFNNIEKITYNKYLNKKSSKETVSFYNFLKGKKTLKIIEKIKNTN